MLRLHAVTLVSSYWMWLPLVRGDYCTRARCSRLKGAGLLRSTCCDELLHAPKHVGPAGGSEFPVVSSPASWSMHAGPAGGSEFPIVSSPATACLASPLASHQYQTERAHTPHLRVSEQPPAQLSDVSAALHHASCSPHEAGDGAVAPGEGLENEQPECASVDHDVGG